MPYQSLKIWFEQGFTTKKHLRNIVLHTPLILRKRLARSIDDTCGGMGFCAEHNAIAAMVTHGENRIKKIVAVVENGIPISPCGRCREFVHQINEGNLDAEVVIGKNKSVKLKDLLPLPWDTKG